MACTFIDQEIQPSIEEQLKNYCLSLVSEGMCNIQDNQVTLNTTEEQAKVFYNTRCSDIEYIHGNPNDNFKGNFDYYKYNSTEIIVYKLTDRIY